MRYVRTEKPINMALSRRNKLILEICRHRALSAEQIREAYRQRTGIELRVETINKEAEYLVSLGLLKRYEARFK
jgi:membrane carboxypeptidase/penicillin-binding protein